MIDGLESAGIRNAAIAPDMFAPGTCRADLDLDGVPAPFDFFEYADLSNVENPEADRDGQGVLDLLDFLESVNEFNGGR